MKKIILIMTVLALALSFAACGNSAPAAPAKAVKSKVEVDYMWSAPVMRPGHWENGVFIEEKL